MKKIVVLVYFLLACAGAAYADNGTLAAPRMNALVVIQHEYADAVATYEKARQGFSDTPEGRTNFMMASKDDDKKRSALFSAAVQLAKTNPKSSTGFAALEWVLNSVSAYDTTAGPPAFDLMAKEYCGRPEIGKVIANIAYYLPWTNAAAYQPAVNLLHAVADKNPDRTARGQAVLGLAWLAKREFETVEWNSSPATERLAARAVQAFETVIADYGDCPDLRTQGIRPATSDLSGEAKPELYELQHLRTGLAAPDIKGDDLNGLPLNLSDYRGKVVLLVFWASWCGPCMGAIPHEKSLVEHFKGRPFVLIGISGDASRTNAIKAVVKNEIPWRTFWDGVAGPDGDIAMAWNIRRWPTIYALDREGVIRLKGSHALSENELEKLMNEAKK